MTTDGPPSKQATRPTFSVENDYVLDACNTFGLPARSRFAARVESEAALAAIFRDPAYGAMPCRVLGGGSNVILRETFNGLTILVRLIGKRLLEERDDAWIVEAAAGEIWHDLVLWTIDQGLPGLENLALIPGTVGAAPVQNIGAYGVELADRFDHLWAYDRHDARFVRMDAADCQFAYRDSVFKHDPGRFVVTRVAFRLPRPWRPVVSYADLSTRFGSGREEPTPRAIADAVVAVRRRKLPDVALLGNAGSFFHNPVIEAADFQRLSIAYPGIAGHVQPDNRVKLSAAWLIDQCGLKGARTGNVGVFDRHALVLVNHGGGSFADLMAMADRVEQAVRSRFGVTLTREPLVM
jgi:UDP-N-acetylmuramate dehydrogenase